jgi:transcriptional regulator with XRE-family HTH domain
MDDARFGRLIRMLRQRRGWRQVDLAARAGVGVSVVARLEAGRLGPIRTATLRTIVGAFGLSFDAGLRGLGAEQDRLLDEKHALVLGSGASWLKGLGWVTAVEVSYSEYGERGSIDILAWHPSSATVLVIEVKTELASVEATLRKHDEKARLARTISRREGWQPRSVARLLVLPEDRTQRRNVERHSAVLGSAYPLGTRAVRAWCRNPSGPMSGLMFLLPPASTRTGASGTRRARIRLSMGDRSGTRPEPIKIPRGRPARPSR